MHKSTQNNISFFLLYKHAQGSGNRVKGMETSSPAPSGVLGGARKMNQSSVLTTSGLKTRILSAGDLKTKDCVKPRPHDAVLRNFHTETTSKGFHSYYTASSASGQDESNPAL